MLNSTRKKGSAARVSGQKPFVHEGLDEMFSDFPAASPPTIKAPAKPATPDATPATPATPAPAASASLVPNTSGNSNSVANISAAPKSGLSDEDKREIAAANGLVALIGLSMFACLFIGALIGRTLDRWLNTSPLLIVIFTFLGAIASFKVLYDLVIKKWMK